MQYALKQRALELGWPEVAIHIIDRDLGTTATSAEHREGFKETLAQVTWDKSGSSSLLMSLDSPGTVPIGTHCSMCVAIAIV